MTDIKDKDLLTALEVCVLIPCSYNALNYWYRWRESNPDNEYAQLLPDYIQVTDRQTRYWKREDVAKLIQFKNTVPQGRKGIMGDITQKYRRAKKAREELKQNDKNKTKRKPGRPRKQSTKK